MAMQVETYFARVVHGGHRVRKLDSGLFEVDWPTGSMQYPSARKTLIAITNRNPQPGPEARDPKIGFARYFKISTTPTDLDTLSLFSPLSVVDRKSRLKTTNALSIHEPVRGIDLTKRGHEVAKLFYAGFARSCVNYGYSPEDVLQEVYKGILIRNKGTCPFDPKKSTFGHYVHLIIKCVLANYHRKWGRVGLSEQIGLLGDDGEHIDAASSNMVTHDSSDLVEMGFAFNALVDKALEYAVDNEADAPLTKDVAAKMAMGYRKSDLERFYRGKCRPFMLERAITSVKSAAQSFRGGLG